MSKQLTTHEFILKAQKVHNFHYNYDSIIYSTTHEKVEIVCKNHGLFFQIASNHLRGHGCPFCARELTSCKQRLDSNLVINKMQVILGDHYDLTRAEYRGKKHKVVIGCSQHGDFMQSPEKILRGQLSCKGCRKGGKSHVSQLWLKSLGLGNLIIEYRIKDLDRIVDGYDPITNTIYEFHGDFWHGNPEVFVGYKFNRIINKTFGKLYTESEEKDAILRLHGYNLVVMWENDWSKHGKV